MYSPRRHLLKGFLFVPALVPFIGVGASHHSLSRQLYAIISDVVRDRESAICIGEKYLEGVTD